VERTTIQDVARAAGVCIGTVSRVLNNKDRVAPRTRARIQRIVERTGYRPSAAGRALVLRRTHTIMLLLHNIADPHCTSLAKHLSRHCRTNGYKMLVGDSDYDPAIEAEFLRAVQDRSVDGLIVSPLAGRRNLPLYGSLVAAHFPTVTVMDSVPGTALPCVKYDDRGAGRMATDYLFDRGHRQIVFAGWHTEFQTVKDRFHGYAASHRARGVTLRSELCLRLPKVLVHTEENLAAALALSSPPTAILAENEMVAVSCLNALALLRRRVPEDVAVMVFGDQIPEGATVIPLTVVSWDESELGKRALGVLVRQIDRGGQRRAEALVETLPPHLIIRQSA
jgi:LacI family transcriptional regulator